MNYEDNYIIIADDNGSYQPTASNRSTESEKVKLMNSSYNKIAAQVK